MKIAVITPYYQESLAQLEKCHQSVLAQQGNVTHFMLADGYPKPEIDQWDCQHFILPNHNDFGDTPRGIGAASASAQGFEGICFLDGDNWYEPEHISNILACYERLHTPVITTARNLYSTKGVYLGKCTESDGKEFVDTNCYFFHQSVFGLCRSWLFKSREQASVGDRILWGSIIERDIHRAYIDIPTVNYVTNLALHYQTLGFEIPLDSVTFSLKRKYFITYAQQLEDLRQEAADSHK